MSSGGTAFRCQNGLTRSVVRVPAGTVRVRLLKRCAQGSIPDAQSEGTRIVHPWLVSSTQSTGTSPPLRMPPARGAGAQEPTTRTTSTSQRRRTSRASACACALTAGLGSRTSVASSALVGGTTAWRTRAGVQPTGRQIPNQAVKIAEPTADGRVSKGTSSFGLRAKGQTLDEIGRLLGVSRERIRQMKHQARRKKAVVAKSLTPTADERRIAPVTGVSLLRRRPD